MRLEGKRRRRRPTVKTLSLGSPNVTRNRSLIGPQVPRNEAFRRVNTQDKVAKLRMKKSVAQSSSNQSSWSLKGRA